MKLIMRGDIFNVDLGRPYGSEQGGIRPCLVIQNDTGNEFSTTTIVIPSTTSTKNYTASHVRITSLNKPSYLLCEQIRIVDKARFKNKLGKLKSSEMVEVERVLKLQLGMGD